MNEAPIAQHPSMALPTPTPAVNRQPIEPTQALLDELAAKSAELEPATPLEILKWSVDRFGDGLTMGTAFGPEA